MLRILLVLSLTATLTATTKAGPSNSLLDVTPDGLLVRLDDGTDQLVLTGDVIHLRTA